MMDEIVKEIIRSWNWPLEGTKKFSDRPNPFNVSRKNNLSSGTVYRKWKFLFESGYVKRIIFLPADSIVRRSAVLITGVERKNFNAIILKMKNYYFLEKAHFYLIYDASGVWNTLKNLRSVILLEFVNSTPELKIKQTRLLMSSVSKNYKIIPFADYDSSNYVDLDRRLLRLCARLSYSDLNVIDLNKFASDFSVSEKTINRWLDSLLAKRVVALFPVFNQSLISGFNTAVAMISDPDDRSGKLVLGKVMKLDLLFRRYLVYRVINGTLKVILYYDFPEELDKITYELATQFNDFALFYRHETTFNDSVERRLETGPFLK